MTPLSSGMGFALDQLVGSVRHRYVVTTTSTYEKVGYISFVPQCCPACMDTNGVEPIKKMAR